MKIIIRVILIIILILRFWGIGGRELAVYHVFLFCIEIYYFKLPLHKYEDYASMYRMDFSIILYFLLVYGDIRYLMLN